MVKRTQRKTKQRKTLRKTKQKKTQRKTNQRRTLRKTKQRKTQRKKTYKLKGGGGEYLLGHFITKKHNNEFEVLYNFDTGEIVINLLSNKTTKSFDIDTFILNFKLEDVKVGFINVNIVKKYKYKDKIVLDTYKLLKNKSSVYNDPKTLYDNIKFLKNLKTNLSSISPELANTDIKKQLLSAFRRDSSEA